MHTFNLILADEIVGVRVCFFELKRAYDIGLGLFQRWNEGRLNVEDYASLLLFRQNGKYRTRDEIEREPRDAGIDNYLELIYDTDVCNLVDFIVKFPDIVFGETVVFVEGKRFVIDDVDFSINSVIVRNDSGLTPYWDKVSISMLDKYEIVY